MDTIKSILVTRFEEIQRKILLVLEQLNDEQVNYRPNAASNSIANLIVHVNANVCERVGKGVKE